MIRAPATTPKFWPGPVALIDVDVAAPPADIRVEEPYSRATLRLRSQERLVGLAEGLDVSDGTLTAGAIRDAVNAARPTDGWLEPGPPPPAWPSMSVAVCTRGRGQRVLATVDAFMGLQYEGRLEILVIENVPPDDALKRAIESVSLNSDREVRYAEAPRPGLSRARNRALEIARGEIIAFTDDDATPEPGWAAAIASAMSLDARVGAVSGLTLPAEIETPAQEWCENFDAFNSGRRFEREVYRPKDRGTHPLYPFPLRIAGVNMALRRDLLQRIGGFVPALGAGTPTAGGEDTAVAAEVLLHGYDIRYEPQAVVHHTHRREEAELLKMMHGYGTGGAAYMTWCLHRHPLRSLGLAGRVPDAARYFLTRGGSHDTGSRNEIPEHLTRATRRGMLSGPSAYMEGLRMERSFSRAALNAG